MLSNDLIDSVNHFEMEWDVTYKIIIQPDDPEYDSIDEYETENTYDGDDYDDE